jgi:GGDEF domain-containing protein
MMSIRKVLEPDVESLQILLRVAQVLIEGIARNVLAYEPEAYDRFNDKMLDLAAEFTERASGGDCLVQAGAAVRALADYTDLANLHVKKTRQEVDHVITLLTQTIAATSSAGSESVLRLQQIEGQVSEAKGVSDLRVLRARLEDCLVSIRQEAKRRADETTHAATVLSREVQKISKQPPAADPAADPLTALPTREQGEKVLSSMCASLKGFVAVLTLDRLQLYNARYGRSLGDDILRFFAAQLKELSPPDHCLFRWTGPTIVVLSNRVINLEDARCEIRRVQEKMPAFEFELETRSASLKLSSRWAVFPTVAAMSVLLRKIEMFAVVQGARVATDQDLALEE